MVTLKSWNHPLQLHLVPLYLHIKLIVTLMIFRVLQFSTCLQEMPKL